MIRASLKNLFPKPENKGNRKVRFLAQRAKD